MRASPHAEQDLGSAYEELQAQNTRLLHRLSEGDDKHGQLMAERVKVRVGTGQGSCHGRVGIAGERWKRLCKLCRGVKEQDLSTMEWVKEAGASLHQQ